MPLLVCLAACRTSPPAAPPENSEPARASVAPIVEPRVQQAAPEAAVPERAAAKQDPAPPAKSAPPSAPPNRDRLGNADVTQYIAQLESASRITELRVPTVIEKLALPVNAIVGDLGCGPGAFVFAFAKACPEGVVFASDIEPRQLDVVRAKIRSTLFRNVVPVLASDDDPHFPPGMLDLVFIADTYHHLDDRVTYLRRLVKTLAPGGRLAILDYKPGKLEIGPPPEHKLAEGVMKKELIEAGWRFVERFDTHPFHDFEIWRPIQPWEKK
ncbi:MAG: class I SAM-dependent methyltransferase [Planctomycetes bacterium]|nr:class I SAM-dependent methyltransferase [Planctomycetota bacterium]